VVLDQFRMDRRLMRVALEQVKLRVRHDGTKAGIRIAVLKLAQLRPTVADGVGVLLRPAAGCAEARDIATEDQHSIPAALPRRHSSPAQ
jgi:hypothetical protein